MFADLTEPARGQTIFFFADSSPSFLVVFTQLIFYHKEWNNICTISKFSSSELPLANANIRARFYTVSH